MKHCQCLHEIRNNLPRTRLCFVPCDAQRWENIDPSLRRTLDLMAKEENLLDFWREVDWLCWRRGCEIVPNTERKPDEHPTLIVRDPNKGTERKLVYLDGESESLKPKTTLEIMKGILGMLSEKERAELFSEFCRTCGSNDPRCTCMRDE